MSSSRPNPFQVGMDPAETVSLNTARSASRTSSKRMPVALMDDETVDSPTTVNAKSQDVRMPDISSRTASQGAQSNRRKSRDPTTGVETFKSERNSPTRPVSRNLPISPRTPSERQASLSRQNSLRSPNSVSSRTGSLRHMPSSQRNSNRNIDSSGAIMITSKDLPPEFNLEPTTLNIPDETVINELKTTTLPRGGVIVHTSLGLIQIGMPPETVKDAMKLGLEIPTHYIVPPEPFNKVWGENMGINVAEFEFPAYCNFFLQGRSINLVVDSKLVEIRIRQVLQETLFGPEKIEMKQDYPIGTPEDELPLMEEELKYFRKFGDKLMELDDLISFTHYDESKCATITDSHGHIVQIEKFDNCYSITDDLGQTTVMDTVELPTNVARPIETNELFRPPVFGVTVLGNSHGFDPRGKTSGYVLWINRRGIMIDPPPYSSAILKASHIPSVLIDGVIVTHCHADHDGGTFQKILQEDRVSLITTRTIFDSFIRKYSSLSGLDSAILHEVLNFRAVRINDPTSIRGAQFRFFYSLHSIPCIGFEVEYEGKRIVFSGDHMNDPEKIRVLHDDGVITHNRMKDLLDFPWDCDLILHEAGVPPIHTPLTTLEKLPMEVRKRLYVVHIAERDVPRGSGLKIAPEGVQNTIIVNTDSNPDVTTMEILDLVGRIELFSNLKLSHAQEILHMAKKRHYAFNEIIVQEGTIGSKFFVILSGEAEVFIPHDNAKVRGNKSKTVKKFITGDYFGEQALVSNGGLRTADIIANSDVDVIEFDSSDFHWLLRETDIRERIAQLSKSREHHAWETMGLNSLLGRLTSKQKTLLEGKFYRRTVHAGDEMWKQDSPAKIAILIEEGRFEIVESKRRNFISNRRRGLNIQNPTNEEKAFGKGVLLGDFDALASSDPLNVNYSLQASSAGTVLEISKDDFHFFVKGNPGILLALMGKKYMK